MKSSPFNQNCFAIDSFASRLQTEITLNDEKSGKNFSTDTIDILIECFKSIKMSAVLALHIENLYSEGINESQFRYILEEMAKKELKNG